MNNGAVNLTRGNPENSQQTNIQKEQNEKIQQISEDPGMVPVFPGDTSVLRMLDCEKSAEGRTRIQ